MAERINKGVRSAEEAERHARVLQEIEAHIEGMEDVRAAPLCPTLHTHTCVHLWSPGIVAMSISTVVSPVCLHLVYQHLYPFLSTSMSFSISASGRVTHSLTASGGWMGCCFHWLDPWSGAKGSPGSGEGVRNNN